MDALWRVSIINWRINSPAACNASGAILLDDDDDDVEEEDEDKFEKSSLRVRDGSISTSSFMVNL